VPSASNFQDPLETSDQTKKSFWVLVFQIFSSFLLVFERVQSLLRRVRGFAADAGVGVSDEGDPLDDLLPRGLDPRVLAGLRHCVQSIVCVRVLCVKSVSECQECVRVSRVFESTVDQ
jgi:hypothetical protein